MAGFWNGTGAGIATAGANIVGSVISTAMQNKANERAYERQQADALAQWNRQNEYDSPKAQMARFQEAGLNPDMIYGQMSNGSTMDSNASLQQVAPDFSQVGSVFSQSMLNAQQVQSQVGLNDAQANYLNAQADDLSNRSPYMIKQLEATIRELNSSADKLDSERKYQDIVNKFEKAFRNNSLIKSSYEAQIATYTVFDLFAQLSHKFDTKILPEPLAPFVDEDTDGSYYVDPLKFLSDNDGNDVPLSKYTHDELYDLELFLKRNENRILEYQGNEFELNQAVFKTLSDRFGLDTASILRYILDYVKVLFH